MNIFSRADLAAVFLKGWRPYAWLAGLVFLVFFKTLFFGFVHYDDFNLIMELRDLPPGLPILLQVFGQNIFSSMSGCYRPLLLASYIIGVQWGGTSPWLPHFTNLVIHIFGSGLVFLLLVKLGYRRGPAFVFSALFAVHPALAGSVAWIVGRGVPLSAVFILASFVFLLEFLETKKKAHYFFHILCFALALLAKESAIVAPLLGIMYLGLLSREKLFSFSGKCLLAGWLITAVIWLWLWLEAVASVYVTGATQIGFFLPAAIQYLGKVFFPFNLSVLPDLKDTTFIYGFISLFLLAAAWRLAKRKRPNFIVFGIAWFILFLSPSFFTDPFRAGNYLDQSLYLPMFGVIIFLLETVNVNDFTALKKSSWALVGIIIMLFSALTFNFCGNYKDRSSFWRNASLASPSSELPDYAAGLAALEINQTREAEESFNKALAKNPRSYGALLELGNIYYTQKKIDRARAVFEQAAAAKPGAVTPYSFLIALYQKQKNFSKARFYIELLKRQGINVRP